MDFPINGIFEVVLNKFYKFKKLNLKYMVANELCVNNKKLNYVA